MYRDLEHPEITWIERTGSPSCIQEGDGPEIDEDFLYEEKRERDLFEKE